MKKILIIMLVLISCFGISQAQNKQDDNKVVVLYGYLYVFPESLGKFSEIPVNLISNINKQKMYGYNDWRLPTVEELQLICANKEKLKIDRSENYMSDVWKKEDGTYVRFDFNCEKQESSQYSFFVYSVVLVRAD